MDTILTTKEVHILKHSWGFDAKQPGYRNHYCGDPENTPELVRLRDEGWLSGPHNAEWLCAPMWYLTDKAVDLLRAMKSGQEAPHA